MTRREQRGDYWALLKYAEHCRLGGDPFKTVGLRNRALVNTEPTTLAALEAEMPPPLPQPGWKPKPARKKNRARRAKAKRARKPHPQTQAMYDRHARDSAALEQAEANGHRRVALRLTADLAALEAEMKQRGLAIPRRAPKR